MSKAILFIATAMLAASSNLIAAELPRYHPEAYCKTVSNVSGGSAMIYSSCIDMEQTAYNKLKTAWSSIAPRTRTYCDEIGRISGGSYSMLDGCVDMELDAAADTKKFKF